MGQVSALGKLKNMLFRHKCLTCGSLVIWHGNTKTDLWWWNPTCVSWKIFCGSETVVITLHQHVAFTMKIHPNTKNVERWLRMWSAWISSGLDSLAAWLSMSGKFQSADEEATEFLQPLVSPEFPSENQPCFRFPKCGTAICLLVAVLCKREISLWFPLFCLIWWKLHDVSLKPQTLFHEMLTITLHYLEVCFLKRIGKWAEIQRGSFNSHTLDLKFAWKMSKVSTQFLA